MFCHPKRLVVFSKVIREIVESGRLKNILMLDSFVGRNHFKSNVVNLSAFRRLQLARRAIIFMGQ